MTKCGNHDYSVLDTEFALQMGTAASSEEQIAGLKHINCITESLSCLTFQQCFTQAAAKHITHCEVTNEYFI